MSFHVPEKFRVLKFSSQADGNNGLFLVHSLKLKIPLKVMASDGKGWEHVSVSTNIRCPIWDEMCFVKDLFWDDEDIVVQYHPPKSAYVNTHPFCLHLWRPTTEPIILPPPILIGFRKERYDKSYYQKNE